MNKFFFFMFAISSLMFSCNNSSTNQTNNSTDGLEMSDEDKALKAVMTLPEYKEANIQVRALTSGEQTATCIIDAPTDESPNFYIQVGYNMERWFEPLYIFIVNPETFDVYIDDNVEGDIVPIETWRQRENRR